jgi:AraC-like DNA-binding protein
MRILISAICVGTFLCRGLTPIQGVAQKDAQAPALTKGQWREDLRYFAGELPKRHKNLYHATSREKFEQAVAELDAAIPSLQDHQIIVRMHQIAATVGDGHTGVHLPPYFKSYPIRLYWFGRELAVGVHPVYLASAFRRHYRCSIGEYKRRLRVEFICGEIARSDAPLSQVALAAGYSDQAHFSRSFKRFAGMTPRNTVPMLVNSFPEKIHSLKDHGLGIRRRRRSCSEQLDT